MNPSIRLVLATSKTPWTKKRFYLGSSKVFYRFIVLSFFSAFLKSQIGDSLAFGPILGFYGRPWTPEQRKDLFAK
jgi:hypothetical protein